jgi:5-(carboxyamino)imidazole ribonucleotide synthase
MLALAARRLGYRVAVYSPEEDSPAGQVADIEVVAPYEDEAVLKAFAQRVDVVTLEFENIPVSTLELLDNFVPVRPGRTALYTTQQRLREKSFLAANGFPVAPFHPVATPDDLAAGLKHTGTPAVLKTAGYGYDGKGQRKVGSLEEAERAFAALGGQPAVLESFVDFAAELSVVAACGLDREFVHYCVTHNHHVNHILDLSLAPAELPERVRQEAVAIARGVLEGLELVGVACVELFLTQQGSLLVNEIAPRPHNSGHLTIDACATSQFEQQLRSVCGLPLGSTELLRPAAMANLLGDLWQPIPDWAAALAYDVKLHLYGKRQARPGRKMGHLTALATSPQEAAERVRAARAALQR